MNRLKSIFVLWYPALVLVIAVGSIGAMLAGGPSLAWSGALLTTLPFIGLYLRAVSSSKLARTSHNLPILSLLTLAGGALAFFGYTKDPGSGYLPVIAATP